MIKASFTFAIMVSVATSAVAVTMPAPLRDNTPNTGNQVDFRRDDRYSFWDSDGTAISANGAQQAGFLARTYNLTPIAPPMGTSNTVLPQLERVVVDFNGGTVDPNSGRSYGVFVPNSATGLPPSMGGTGVFASLNSGTSLNATSSTVSTNGPIDVPWQNFQDIAGIDLVDGPPPVVFSISRIGANMTVRIGDQTGTDPFDHIWTVSGTAVRDIDALQLRMRAGGGFATWRVTDLLYNGSALTPTIDGIPTTTYQADTLSLSGFKDTEIFLWDDLVGNFTLTGNISLGWTDNIRPNGGANVQISFLDVEPVPEPSSWAMMIAGFGLVGAAMRRANRKALLHA